MFKKIFLISLICLSSIFCNQDLPQIDLYFETLCPGCQEFITTSFQDFLNNPNHSDLAKVNFHPYGNAIEVKKGDQYEFTCQHGEIECYGNTVEVCALNKLSYEDGLKYIICMENGIKTYNKNIKKALLSCIEDSDLAQNILTCAENEEGNNLQHQVAQRTPKHDYVPWLTYNGVHSENDEDDLMNDMLGFLCALEVNKNKEVCLNYKRLLKQKDYEYCENVTFNDYLNLKFLS
jgi:interferon gamma-inducible protein 30